jgi:hypothetical protein
MGRGFRGGDGSERQLAIRVSFDLTTEYLFWYTLMQIPDTLHLRYGKDVVWGLRALSEENDNLNLTNLTNSFI